MIYIAYHKPYPLLTVDPSYVRLHVGKALSDRDMDMTGDDTGDHISAKNKTYSELTGLYWIWKNTTSGYVGLCHYHRFFSCRKPDLMMRIKKIGEYLIRQGKHRSGIFYISNIQRKKLVLTGQEASELLKVYDAIIPRERKMKYSVWEQYEKRHIIKDLRITKEIILKDYPDFIPAFDQVMEKKEIFPCNMFVMRRDLFNTYMAWLFHILFELEKRTDTSGYDPYQMRLYGFISERLFDVWLTKNNVNAVRLPILFFRKTNL